MENKKNILSEVYRNLELMNIDSTHLIEQNFFDKIGRKILGKLKPKSIVGITSKLQTYMKSNLTVQNMINNSNPNPKEKFFIESYKQWISDSANTSLQNKLIINYLDLPSPTVLSKTELINDVVNIGYNKLSNILGQINQNPKEINNILTSNKITDPETIEILKKYYNIYKKYGSNTEVLTINSINKLKKLAEDSSFFETFMLYKQTIIAYTESWKYGKEGLEAKMLEKYRGYLTSMNAVRPDQVESVTLAYKKSIDNTFRAYLTIQDDLASDYLAATTKSLKVKALKSKTSKNKNILEFTDIIEEIKAGTLGEKYPGFKLTQYLLTHLDKGVDESVISIERQIINSLTPKISKEELRRVKDITISWFPNWLKSALNNKYGKKYQRIFTWGTFPNRELLYKLIAYNRNSFQKNKRITLLKLYLQYSFLGALRSSIQTILIPAAYSVYTIASITLKGENEKNNWNIPFIPKLTDEEKELLKYESVIWDIGKIFLTQFYNHYLRNWTLTGGVKNDGLDAKIHQIAYGIGLPNEVKTFNSAIAATIITKFLSFDIGGLPNKKYSSFYSMIFSLLTPIFDGEAKKIENEVETETERIQAGGSGIDVTEKQKTWKYSSTKKPGLKFIIIDYPFSNIKELKINDKVNSSGKSYDNNTTRTSVKNNETISTITIVDKNDKTLIVRYAR